MLFVDHLRWSHPEQMVTNCRMGAGVGHREPPQRDVRIYSEHTDYSCYDRSYFIYMKGSKLKMYKRSELGMFCVHSNSVEPKVQHQDLQRPYHFVYSSINKKVILIDLRFRHNIAYFCSILPTKMVPNTATALFCSLSNVRVISSWVN